LAGYAAIERLTLMGSSSINGIGNGLSNTITGNSANNTLNGAAGNDTLLGGTGADRLYGGLGNDTLTGGTGADAFVFHATPNAATNVDRITDFSVADDAIWLENGVFTALGAAGALSSAAFVRNTTGLAQDASDRLIYESDTGELYYDSNGSAAGGSVLIAVLNPNLLMTHMDFTVI
ncbi:MAG: calcium-binding protein, partial [Rhizobium sp.]|nr:calcium-binding protein [Rhizobium sp.]